MHDETAFQNLATSKKRNPVEKAQEETAGREQQADILSLLHALPDHLYTNRRDFRRDLNALLKQYAVSLPAALRKAIENALSEPDETAEICRDKDGNPEADSNLRDYEFVPLAEDIGTYFENEVLPHVPDAWINADVTDPLDHEVGYEINFNRYFYKYQPPRPLEEIEADIRQLEREIMTILTEVTR